MSRSLLIEGRLELIGDNGTMAFVGTGREITIDAPNWATLAALLRPLPIRPGAPVTDFADQLNHRADLDIRVTLRGRTLARMGPDARPSWLTRQLGFGPFEVYLLRVMWAYLRG